VWWPRKLGTPSFCSPLVLDAGIGGAATKGFLTADDRLRHEPGPIPGEQDGLSNVREVEELLHEPVEPESPAAVRRHAVSERFQVEFEVLRLHALLLNSRQKHVVSMLPLSSGGHLVSLVLEVE